MTPQATAYAQAHGDLEATISAHSALIQGGASVETVLESRYALERVKARLHAARGALTNAEWARLADAESLTRAVEVLLAGVLVDARADVRADSRGVEAARR